MKKLLLLLLCAAMTSFIGCQKESGPVAPAQTAASAKAGCKCGTSCTQCHQNCLFCNCTRDCTTCGNQISPNNHCVCGNGGGNTGGDLCSRCDKNPCECIPCRECGRMDCVCNKDTSYPIEHMDANKFSSEGGAGSQQAAFRVRANYLRTGPSGWPGHDETRGEYIVYDGDRFDRSASNLGRLHIDEQLKKFKVPVIAKIRCIPEDIDHMYYGLEYYVAITGTGGPETYYTYMDLKITSYMEFACDTQNNRFLFEGSDKPLRDPQGTYAGCPYIVVEIY